MAFINTYLGVGLARITGRVEVVVNGERLLNRSGATAIGISDTPGYPGVFRRTVVGIGQRPDGRAYWGPTGMVEEMVPARVEVTVTDRDDRNLTKLCGIKGDGTVVFRRDASGGLLGSITGAVENALGMRPKQYILNNVTCMNPASVVAGEGDVVLAFEACEGGGWTEEPAS